MAAAPAWPGQPVPALPNVTELSVRLWPPTWRSSAHLAELRARSLPQGLGGGGPWPGVWRRPARGLLGGSRSRRHGLLCALR